MADLQSGLKIPVEVLRPSTPYTMPGVLFEGDENANRITLVLMQNGEPADIGTVSVSGEVERADGNRVPCKGEQNGNELSIILNANCYNVPGACNIFVIAKSEGVERTLAEINAHVRGRSNGAIVEVENVIPSIADILQRIDELEAAGIANVEAIEAKGQEVLESLPDDYTALAGEVSQLSDEIADKADAIIVDVSGPIVTVSDAAAQTAVQLISHIEPVQEGEGDPSLDNVRTISGWDKAIAQGEGKNLMPNGATTLTTNGITYTVNDDLSVTVNGTATGNAYLPLKDTVYLSAGTEVVVDSGSDNADVGVQLYTVKDDGSFKVTVTSSGKPIGYTVQEMNKFMGYVVVHTGITVNNVTVYPMLRLKTEKSTEYEPCNNQTLTADLPETVYGGTRNWTTGVLTVDKAKFVADGVTNKAVSVSRHANGLYYAVLNLPKSSVRTLDNPNNPLSDKFIAKGGVAVGACYIAGSGYRSLVITPIDQTLTTAEAVNAWLADNPVTFIYDLAEPYTIQLTPQQLALLKGTNNVWSTTGDTNLTYIADTKLYIDGKFEELQNAILAQGASI